MIAQKLYETLIASGIPAESIRILDSEYRLMTKDFLLNEFAQAFKQLKVNLGSDVYKINVNDCDKVALLAHWYAQYLHSQSGDTRESGIAFGNITFKRDDGIVHQINVAVVDYGEVIFFEPQDESRVSLSDNEKFLCTALNI